MSEENEFVYEVLDYTDDEMYYPLGIFKSLHQAENHIIESEKPDRAISWHACETERIVIRKRKIGWSGNGKDLLEINRHQVYDEESDTYLWTRSDKTSGDIT